MKKEVVLNYDDELSDDEKVVMDKLIILQEEFLTKNIEGLNNLFHEDFILVRGSGRKETKMEFLDEIKKDILKYYKTEISDPKIAIEDDTALITAKVVIKAKLLDVKSIWNLKSRFVLKKIDDDWHFVEWDTS